MLQGLVPYKYQDSENRDKPFSFSNNQVIFMLLACQPNKEAREKAL